jgi:hypothetical protein
MCNWSVISNYGLVVILFLSSRFLSSVICNRNNKKTQITHDYLYKQKYLRLRACIEVEGHHFEHLI